MRLRYCAAQPADPSGLYKLLSCIFIYSNIMYELKSRPRLLKYGLPLKIESTRQIRLTHGLMVKTLVSNKKYNLGELLSRHYSRVLHKVGLSNERTCNNKFFIFCSLDVWGNWPLMSKLMHRRALILFL